MSIDSDDFIKPNCISEIVEIINLNPNVDIICGKFIEYYSNEKIRIEQFEYEESKLKDKSGEEVLSYLFKEIPVIMWSACRSIYKRSLIINNNLFFTEGITSEDFDLIPRLYLNSNKIVGYNNLFYFYSII